MRIEPLEYSDSPFYTGMEGGESWLGFHVAYTPPIIWNERSAQLASWCVSYDEDSLIMFNEPLEYSDSPTCKCMEGGES